LFLSIFIGMDNKVTVLLPGGFKPPHAGHLGLANKFASRSDVGKVIVMIGPSERDGVNRQQSVAIWNLLPTNPKVEVVSVGEDSPMNAAFGYVFNLPKNSDEIIALAASSKSPEDAQRSKIFKAAINRYKTKPTKNGVTTPKNVSAIEMTDDVPTNYQGRDDEKNGQNISASTLRKDLANGNFENFQTNYPGVKTGVVKSIYNILTKKKSMDEARKKKLKTLIKKIIKEEDIMAALLDPTKFGQLKQQVLARGAQIGAALKQTGASIQQAKATAIPKS